MGRWWGLVKATVQDFAEDGGTQQAAALSYYTVFSLPPLLILLVTILGWVLGPEDVQQLVSGESARVLGPAAGQLKSILEHAERPGGSRSVAGVLGILALLIGATGAFLALQSALNRLWEVKPDPARGGVKRLLVKRIFSFGMLLTVGFLMLVSLVVSTLLQVFGKALGGVLPEPLSGGFLQALTFAVSLLVIAALFALIFKYLPDARVAWRDAAVGALATAVLFMIGKFALSIYLGRSDPGSAFGAAASLALLFVWIYYSAIIVFLGAEFTQVWAGEHGREITPKAGAVRVIETAREIRSNADLARATSSARLSGDSAAARPRPARAPVRGKRLLGALGAAVVWRWFQQRMTGPARR